MFAPTRTYEPHVNMFGVLQSYELRTYLLRILDVRGRSLSATERKYIIVAAYTNVPDADDVAVYTAKNRQQRNSS